MSRPPPLPSFGDRWRARRNRWLASPRFQRWAAAFPLTRPIARRHARSLFDLVAGFVYTQILFAGVRLKLFERLAEGPRAAEELAGELTLSIDACERLLAACASLDLAERRGDGRYGLGPLGAALLGNPGIVAMIEHHALLYADLRDPVALLRGETADTALGRYWPYAAAGAAGGARLDGGHVADYSALMSASQPLVADEALDAYQLEKRGHRCLLDVGGGEGTFLCAAARRDPQLQLIVFDLPPVAERARERFAAAGLSGRARAVGGDFLRDELPTGADIVSVVRVLHDHDDDGVLKLLQAIRRALPPGGTLLIAEPMSETPGAEPMGDAYFGFYLLAMGRGRPRSAEALQALLRSAGFHRQRLLPTSMPLQTRVMVAQ